ncbi:hypothetical protein IFM89_036383 [Coptis chinensis]|uniref:Reverse transcriptase zinc-binding domain-containing protein n=1 Tax=Coptis chinensis TaxID=261450 RepID=A0A835M5R6_9MAGN|nr:hypothetical protein IFM89_036383 [Coptis chinensis]
MLTLRKQYKQVTNSMKYIDILSMKLKEINTSMLRKLAWSLETEDTALIGWALKQMGEHQGWVIGNGKSINIWRENWCCDMAISDILVLDSNFLKTCRSKLSNCIVHNAWHFTSAQPLKLQEKSMSNKDGQNSFGWPRVGICLNECESHNYILLSCPFAAKCWNYTLNFFTTASVLNMEAGSNSKKNKVLYDKGQSSYHFYRIQIRKAIYRAYNMSKGFMDNSVHELAILHKLRLQMKYRKAPKMSECYWLPPPLEVIKINTDESSWGNPGDAS